MKLKHLTIANCSRIADIDIDVREHMVLIGPNGSGKTTVLLCLDMLLGMSDQQLQASLSKGLIRDKSRPLTVEAVLGDLDDDEHAAFADGGRGEVLTSSEGEALVGREGKSLADDGDGSGGSTLRVRLDVRLDGDAAVATRYFPRDEMQRQTEAQARPEKQAPPSSRRQTETQRRAFGWKILQAEASSRDVSQGRVSNVADAIRELLRDGANILAIDEPEAHLHPSSQRSLAKMLKAGGTQKILVTHSPTIAGSFEPDEIVVIHADGSAVQPKDGFLGGNVGMLARWWIGRQLEPLTAGTVIAVEGPSDRIIVDRVASAFGFDLDRNDVVLVETNGCGDMKVVESIFGSGGFNIPLYELIDEDALDDAARRLKADSSDLEARGVFTSLRDLEDEYVRAIGPARLWDKMKAEGTFSRKVFSLCDLEPDGYPTEAALAQFIREKSNRKIPSALVAAELIDSTNASHVASVSRLLKAVTSSTGQQTPKR